MNPLIAAIVGAILGGFIVSGGDEEEEDSLYSQDTISHEGSAIDEDG